MVALPEILTTEDKVRSPFARTDPRAGDNDICTDSRVHRGGAENRAPVTRNHRSAPSLGRWMEQDPAQFINGANTYQFVNSSPVGNVDAEGLQVYLGPGSGWGDNSPPPPTQASDVAALQQQGADWLAQGDQYAGRMMLDFANQIFPNGNAGNAFQGIYQEILKSAKYQRAAQAHFQSKAEDYGKSGTYKLAPMIPPRSDAFTVNFKPSFWVVPYGFNMLFGTHVGDLGISLGVAHFGYRSATLTITGCPGHLKWRASVEMMERNRYHFHPYWLAQLDPVYDAGSQLQHDFGFKPFYQQSIWRESFGGSLAAPPQNLTWFLPSMF